MMETTIREGLSSWTEETTDEVPLRLAHAQPSGGRLVLETGRKTGGAWLWAIQQGEVRAFELALEGKEREVLAVVVKLQDVLSPSSYLACYGELQAVCKTSILAYEQFGVTPPFGAAPPPSDGGPSGWGGGSGNKGW